MEFGAYSRSTIRRYENTRGLEKVVGAPYAFYQKSQRGAN